MPKSVAERIVNAIVSDLTDRNGLQNEWESIDEETQAEIKETWTGIVQDHLDSVVV